VIVHHCGCAFYMDSHEGKIEGDLETFQRGPLHEVFEEGRHSREILKPFFKMISLERSEIVELDSSIGKDLAFHPNTHDIRESAPKLGSSKHNVDEVDNGYEWFDNMKRGSRLRIYGRNHAPPVDNYYYGK
jgi:hypothetical protein